MGRELQAACMDLRQEVLRSLETRPQRQRLPRPAPEVTAVSSEEEVEALGLRTPPPRRPREAMTAEKPCAAVALRVAKEVDVEID